VMVTIRTGSITDIEAVLGLWRATTDSSLTDDAGSVARLLARAPDALLLATDHDVLVGTVIVTWDGWRGAMYRLAAIPSQGRRGIATKLVAEGERRLQAYGARRLHMIVAADAVDAQAFWTAAGYEPSDQLRYVKNLG
jgi:ribosomal protein S18 acetylase RimI-like enzyme